MSSPDTLAPDQRAVLELVLLQGRSYGELSELLAIPERDVRARADAGLRALAGEPAAGVDSGRIADWLLGQQPEGEAERTRNAVARNPAAHEWAARAAERLRELGGTTIPEVAARNGAAPAAPARASGPAGAAPAAPPSKRRSPEPGAPPRTAEPAAQPSGATTQPASKPRSSKLGGAALIGVLAVVVAVGLVLLFTSGDDDDPAPAAQPAPTEEPAEDPAAEAAANAIVLNGRGNDAQGLMQLVPDEDGTVRFQIAAQNVPPNRGREVYAVWFTRENGDARRLGFVQTQVGEQGLLTTAGPQRGDEDRFPRWFATYDKVLITRETEAGARRPGRTVLEGTLPGGEG